MGISKVPWAIMKLVLILINTFLLILGVAIAVIGVIVYKFRGAMVSAALAKFEMKKYESTIEEMTKNLTGELDSFGLAILLLGLCLLVISIIGYLAFCCEVKFMLIVYAAFTGLLVVGFSIAAYIVATDKKTVEKKSAGYAAAFVNKTYTGDNKDPMTQFVDMLQASLQCCGMRNSEDFKGAPNWVKKGDAKVPDSCCRMHEQNKRLMGCASKPNAMNSNKDIGCFKIIWRYVAEYLNVVVYLLALIAVVAAVMTALTLTIFFEII